MNTLDEAPRWLLAVVAAAHGAALLALAAPAVRSLAPPRPLAVALVAPPASGAAPAAQAEPLRRLPAPVQPRPQPAAVRSASFAAAASAPTQVQSPAPASSVSASPAPTTALAASAAAAHPAPIQPPRFDAAYLNNPRPPYPPLARRLGEEGKTVLRVYVSAEGLPGQIELLESAGSPRIDAAALEAVKHWRFVPARQGELAIAAWVRVPISFRLENR